MNAALKGKFIALNAYIRKEICSVKDHVKRTRRQATDWEKIFAKVHPIKNYSPKYTKLNTHQ